MFRYLGSLISSLCGWKLNTTNPLDGGEILNAAQMVEAMDRIHGGAINEIVPVAGEGLRLQPFDLTSEDLELRVDEFVSQSGWIVTSIRGGVLIEPRYTREIDFNESLCYHVSDSQNRVSIASNGLRLGSGGNTRLARKYPPRLFLALSLESAYRFIHFQCQSTEVVFRNGRPVRGEPVRSADEFDVWRVSVGRGVKLYSDILFPGEAAWTENKFDATEVSIVT